MRPLQGTGNRVLALTHQSWGALLRYMKKTKGLGSVMDAKAGWDPAHHPAVSSSSAQGFPPGSSLDSKPGQSITQLLQHPDISAMVRGEVGALPFFPIISPQTRCWFAKPAAVKTALQDPAQPHLTRALQ